LIKKLLDSAASLEAQDNQGRTPIDIARTHTQDQRVVGSDKLLASLQHGSSLLTLSEVRQSARKIFQMSGHMVSEQLSLPIEEREYASCPEGMLYMPEDAVVKLHELLQSLKRNEELLSGFEDELSLVISDLFKGNNTGEVFNLYDDPMPKCFDDAADKLESVMKALDAMKQEAGPSGGAEAQVAPRSASR
jgi:hypothetical protein